jgi:hypothetical protein
MINLGDKAKDVVTGFTGIAVAKVRYLQGCNRIALQAPVKKNDKPLGWEYFDEPQLKVIKRNAVPTGSDLTGGYKPDNAERP